MSERITAEQLVEWRQLAEALLQFWHEIVEDDGGESPQMVRTRKAADAIERSAAEVERLREALRFYANPEIYKPHPHGSAFDNRDLSYVARAAQQEDRDGT